MWELDSLDKVIRLLSFAYSGFYQVVPRNHMSAFFTGHVKGRTIPRYITPLTKWAACFEISWSP